MASRTSPERDRALLTAAGFLRATTTSVVGITLGVHLGRLGLSGEHLGAVISAGLLGAAAAAILATLFADRAGKRAFLLGVTALGVAGTLLFAWSSSPLALTIAAFVGMLNGMGAPALNVRAWRLARRRRICRRASRRVVVRHRPRASR